MFRRITPGNLYSLHPEYIEAHSMRWLAKLRPIFGIAITSFFLASTAAGWNGVYIAETAARAPTGLASHVVGISLIMTYAGCITTAPLFLIILSLTGDGYHIAFSLFAVPAILTGLRLLSIERKQV